MGGGSRLPSLEDCERLVVSEVWDVPLCLEGGGRLFVLKDYGRLTIPPVRFRFPLEGEGGGKGLSPVLEYSGLSFYCFLWL